MATTGGCTVTRPPGQSSRLKAVQDFLATTQGKRVAIAGSMVVVFAAGWVGGSASNDDAVRVTSSAASPTAFPTGDPTEPPFDGDVEASADATTAPDDGFGATEPSDDPGSADVPTEPASVKVPDGTVPDAPIQSFTCPATTETVRNAQDLHSALEGAGPGTVITLEDGVYQGNFATSASGSKNEPVYLCGGKGAVLQSDGPKGGYVLHFNSASYWRASGFTVRNGQKGVMVDDGHFIGLQGLLVEDTGDEAVHLRKNSTDNVVRGLTIRKTGHRRDKFGEGVYVGTAQSNWPQITGGQPDHSDRNFVLDNVIYQTTGEAVDVKEGTSDGVVAGNRFDGGSMSGADSWVDIKGNGWLIAGNQGRTTVEDGFQTHVIIRGWGDRNVFTSNVADLAGGSGVAYYLHEPLSNQVACNNKASGGELSNYPCQK
jgi:hypothetical protein